MAEKLLNAYVAYVPMVSCGEVNALCHLFRQKGL